VPTRRVFLQGGGLLGAALGVSAAAPQAPDLFAAPPFELQPVEAPPGGVTRPWLGPSYWANRLQDWRLHDGRLECLTGAAGDEVRTVAVLTREVRSGAGSVHCRVRAGLMTDPGAAGFCGFLIGAGGGDLDYRAAALVQKASGIGGGLLCTYESDGRVRFREHASEAQPLEFAELPAESTPAKPAARDVVLRLDLVPAGAGGFDLKLSAWDPQGGLLAGAVRRGVPEREILGGLLLVSSPPPGRNGARYWFRDLRCGGEKLASHPERAWGPVLGALYSLNGGVLKLSAQLAPVGEQDPQTVRLEYRPSSGGDWRQGPAGTIEPGYTALFRLENWDSSQDWEYRVLYADAAYTGMVRRDPGSSRALTIAHFSCTIAAGRNLEGGPGVPELPAAELLGRYTSRNLYFPHAELVRHAAGHRPDLLVFAGDQLYEGNPTRRDDSETPTLDYLYKWYLWIWSFRELTRNTPAIVQTDDHDVYHGNLWGNGGRAAPQRDQNRGGYRCSAEFVNLVQRTQCGHNPDPFDPAPVDRGVTVYYGSFRYGGVGFAILEDRKFKTAPLQGADLDVHEAELLGERQEKFLEQWAKDWAGVSAKICLAQTLFACVQTSPAGRPLNDFDSNGYPKLGRDRAIELLREAGALMLAGDQHLATLVRHGLDTFTDGVVQFTGPAAGSSWQRWFEPARPLANAGGPHTGDFVDAFGNKVRVLAVANPKVSFREYRRHRPGRSQGLGDRKLKSEGYGIIRVDHQARAFVIECWPWNVDPQAPGARQFPGWPHRLRFEDSDGRRLQ
jgi:alkaline phosphatase D